MKKSTLILTVALVVLTFFGCKPPKEFIDGITTTPSPLEYKGEKVEVAFEGNFPVKYFTKKMTMTVTPVITTSTGKVYKGEPKTYQGEKVKDNNDVVKYKVGGKYTQKATFDYTPDMESSVLTLEAVVSTGKKEYALDPVEVARGVNVTPLLVSTQPGTGDLKAQITADKFQRVIDEKTEAQIKFLVNQANVRGSELKSEEIVSLTKAIKEAKEAENREIRSIEMSSYASPEGGMEFNEKLSKNRGKNSSEYISRQLRKMKASANIDSKTTAEDWEGFQKLVEKSDIQDKAVILRVLSMYTDGEQREKEIRNLAAAYEVIADKILPELRRSQMTLTVSVIGKADEEILRLAKENPSELNVEELLYAATLVPEMDDKAAIYTQATVQFPQEYRAFNNLGMVRYEQGRVDDAARAFARALELNGSDANVNFNNGLVALAKNDMAKAEEFFGKAGGVGAQLDYANGAIAILKGNYKKAVELFGNSSTNNAALANILNKNYGAASKALNANTAANATTHYLKAIVGARTNDAKALCDNLKKAIEGKSSYRSRAAQDVEFITFFDNAEFQAVVK